jgi:hypothetical protein
LHEPYIVEIRSYVELAERVNGAIPRPVEFDYIWGDALAELDRAGPLEERVEVQALSVDLREAVMAWLSGGESRRWTVLELVERFKSLGVCASRAGVTAALVELGLELELSSWAPWRLLAAINQSPSSNRRRADSNIALLPISEFSAKLLVSSRICQTTTLYRLILASDSPSKQKIKNAKGWRNARGSACSRVESHSLAG